MWTPPITFESILRGILALPSLYGHCSQPATYGVGFHLSFDYAVASVYFPNGTSSDVAKIEGSPAYKQLMRTAIPSNTTQKPPYDGAHKALDLIQTNLVLQSLREYAPRWLGGIDRHYQPLSGMLKALKVATESYLEAPLCVAEIALPFYFTEPYYEMLSAACTSLSLNLPVLRLAPAGNWAIFAYGLDGDCYAHYPDPEKMILTIEYSRAALTALLGPEECGILEHRRIVQDTRLGLDSIENGTEASWSDVERALRDVTELPLKDGSGAGLKHIENIVLLGESARDARMQNALRNVLGERYNTLETRNGYAGAIDPLFAASRGVASYCWDRIEYAQRGGLCSVPIVPIDERHV